MEIIPADSPNRCQRVTQSGQCSNPSLPGTTFCDQHTDRLTRQRLQHRQYDIDDARIKQRVETFADHEAIYSLKEEIAILRQFIERLVSSLSLDDTPEARANFAMQAPMIIKLSETLERLVKTSGTLEVKFGSMLAKSTVVALANRIVEILSEEISHIENFEDIVDAVTSRITHEIKNTQNKESNEHD